jgi:DNA-binding transcriptional regulator YiaG
MTIYRLGDALRWSQQVLAEKVDADVTTAQRWESGGVAPCG